MTELSPSEGGDLALDSRLRGNDKYKKTADFKRICGFFFFCLVFALR